MTGETRDPPGHLELARVFLKISLLGFGGPNAHLALMLDEVVERRGWITREHFLHLIGVTNLLPGPNSSEVTIHIGYTQRGWTGALVTGLCFLLPTFTFITALAWLYFRWGTLPEVEPVFWGLKPAIVAIILWAGVRLGRTAVETPLHWALAIGGVVVTILAGRWAVAAMAVGGLITWLVWRTRAKDPGDGPAAAETDDTSGQGRAGWFAVPAVLSLPALGTLGSVFLTHLWIGSVLFGGGYVLVALLEPYAVGQYGWLTSGQFLDGVALSQAVPGPISTLSAFVGYAAGGFPGAVLATAGIYLPAFAAVLLVAPHLERLRKVDPIQAALAGVSAVVAGAILGVGLTLAFEAVTGWLTGAILLGAFAVMAVWKVGAPWIVLAGLLAGVLRLLLT